MTIRTPRSFFDETHFVTQLSHILAKLGNSRVVVCCGIGGHRSQPRSLLLRRQPSRSVTATKLEDVNVDHTISAFLDIDDDDLVGANVFMERSTTITTTAIPLITMSSANAAPAVASATAAVGVCSK